MGADRDDEACLLPEERLDALPGVGVGLVGLAGSSCCACLCVCGIRRDSHWKGGLVL